MYTKTRSTGLQELARYNNDGEKAVWNRQTWQSDIEKSLDTDLEKLIEKSLELLANEFSIELKPETKDEIIDFFIQRLLSMYEKEFSVNIINSLQEFKPLADLKGFIKRAQIVKKYINDSDFAKIRENATRIQRITKEQSNKDVNESLFVLNEEKALYEAIKAHSTKEDNLDEYIKSLSILIEPIVQFFDKVLVMDKDEKIKNNRVALLNLLKEKFSVVCDFEKL